MSAPAPARRTPYSPLLIAAVLALAVGTAAAQAPAGPGEPAHTKQSQNRTDPSGFPEPFAAALLVMVVCGAVGAFAADLVSDGGRLERPGRHEQGFMMGFLGKLVVGSVAAVVALTLNPSGPAWWSLIGAALVAGVGGEALLLSRMAALQAQDDRKDLQAAEAEHCRREVEWDAKIESFRVLAIVAHEQSALLPAGAPVGTGDETPRFVRMVNTYAQRARAEMSRSPR